MGQIDVENIDYDKLRETLKGYFESEQIYKNPFAVSDVLNIDNVSDYKLIYIALENGFDLEEFKKDITR